MFHEYPHPGRELRRCQLWYYLRHQIVKGVQRLQGRGHAGQFEVSVVSATLRGGCSAWDGHAVLI